MELGDSFKQNHTLLMSFPGGQKQFEEETSQLYSMLCGKLTMDESAFLLRRTKALLIIAEDKSETRIVPSIRASTDGKLTEQEARMVYVFLTGISGPTTSGGDGSSAEHAVVINVTSAPVGLSEEYAYIEKKCGHRDIDWTFKSQMLSSKDEKAFDIISVTLQDGSSRIFWFDITAFYRKS